MSKYQIVFKTPDALQTFEDYKLNDIDEEEAELVKYLLKPYVRYGEMVKIEVDTNTQSVKLIKW